MKVIDTGIEGLIELQPRVFEDGRGYFYESYNKGLFNEMGLDYNFVQDNQSMSVKNVLRGLHYQLNPMAQAKLVRVFKGEVFDVAVDIREGSPTYGKWHGAILSEKNKHQLLIPRGFAHGFAVLSDEAEFFYKCDNFYSKETEGGIRFDDSELNVEWPIDLDKAIVSEKDLALPTFADSPNNFTY